jgi:hypothetical protein
MIPNTKITVTHTDGTTGTYPVTPWIIDQWEKMSGSSWFKMIHTITDMEAGNMNLLAFLAERQAGLPVAAWREAFIQSLASLPMIELADDPKETPESSTATSAN